MNHTINRKRSQLELERSDTEAEGLWKVTICYWFVYIFTVHASRVPFGQVTNFVIDCFLFDLSLNHTRTCPFGTLQSRIGIWNEAVYFMDVVVHWVAKSIGLSSWLVQIGHHPTLLRTLPPASWHFLQPTSIGRHNQMYEYGFGERQSPSTRLSNSWPAPKNQPKYNQWQGEHAIEGGFNLVYWSCLIL